MSTAWQHREPAELAALCDLPVLLVDDNRNNRRILEEARISWGMRPILAEGGSQALKILSAPEAAAESRPALVLLDAQMPEMDGFTLAQRMKEHRELRSIPVIMLTSAGLRGDAARCKELGINAYLSKPIKQSDLLECIKRAVGSPGRTKEAQPLMTIHSLREGRSALQILLAEDNAINQKLAVSILERRGHRVIVAKQGRQRWMSWASTHSI